MRWPYYMLPIDELVSVYARQTHRHSSVVGQVDSVFNSYLKDTGSLKPVAV